MDLSQNIGMENTRAILREPDVHQTINYLMLELSASGNIQFLQFHPVSVEQIKRMKPELLADSETFIKPYPPHRQTLGSTQTFFLKIKNMSYRVNNAKLWKPIELTCKRVGQSIIF